GERTRERSPLASRFGSVLDQLSLRALTDVEDAADRSFIRTRIRKSGECLPREPERVPSRKGFSAGCVQTLYGGTSAITLINRKLVSKLKRNRVSPGGEHEDFDE